MYKNLEAINKEMVERWKDVKVNHDYDIPYLAGYSKDGSTVYIDRHIPKEILTSCQRNPLPLGGG